MLCLQLYFVFGQYLIEDTDQKRRILAAATFLIEQRPDLLEEQKVHIATGDPLVTRLAEHGAASVSMREAAVDASSYLWIGLFHEDNTGIGTILTPSSKITSREVI